MHHYTLAWHGQGNTEQHICEYAPSAFEAAQYAKEDVPFLKGHPHFIDKCTKEEE